jgi:hypothetical protein
MSPGGLAPARAELLRLPVPELDDVVRVDDHADGQLVDATRADPCSDLERCALEEQAPERAHPRLISVGRPTEVGPRLHLGLVGRLERDPLSWRDQRLDLVIRGSDEKHAEHAIPVGGVENVELVEGDPHGCGHAAKLRRDGDAVCSRWGYAVALSDDAVQRNWHRRSHKLFGGCPSGPRRFSAQTPSRSAANSLTKSPDPALRAWGPE